MAEQLTDAACAEAMKRIPEWRRGDRGGVARIERSLAFTDFQAAFRFMVEVAAKAEEIQHHPEWSNVYNRVDIALTTHDCGGLSALDFTLAEFIDTRFSAT